MFGKKKTVEAFRKGERVVSIWEPNKIGKVIRISTYYGTEPVYTIRYKDGNEYAGYAGSFRRV